MSTMTLKEFDAFADFCTTTMRYRDDMMQEEYYGTPSVVIRGLLDEVRSQAFADALGHAAEYELYLKLCAKYSGKL